MCFNLRFESEDELAAIAAAFAGGSLDAVPAGAAPEGSGREHSVPIPAR